VENLFFNLVNENLRDKQRHFLGRWYAEVDVVFGLGKLMRKKPKPDASTAGFVVPVKPFT